MCRCHRARERQCPAVEVDRRAAAGIACADHTLTDAGSAVGSAIQAKRAAAQATAESSRPGDGQRAAVNRQVPTPLKSVPLL